MATVFSLIRAVELEVLGCTGGERHNAKKVYQGRGIHSELAPKHGKANFTSFSRCQSRRKKDLLITILFQLDILEPRQILPL